MARALAEAGIGIDVVPIRSRVLGEVAVEKVTIPSDVRRGQPFDLRVVLDNTAAEGEQPQPVEGRLQVVRKAGGREEVLAEQDITLEPGKRVFSIREEIDAARVLHLRSPLRSQERGRRHAAAEQSGHGVHARPRQRPGAVAGRPREPGRVRRAGRTAAGHEPGSAAAHHAARRVVHRPGATAAVRHRDSGQRAARAFCRRTGGNAGAQHAATWAAGW